jgi:RNA polymerase sigma-70 factor, ECF subfamily
MIALQATGNTGGRALATGHALEGAGAAWIRMLTDSDLTRAYRLAGFILGDVNDAEDATQDALGRAWERRTSLRSAETAQAWFDRILVNICRDRLRRRGRVRWLELDDHVRGSTDPFVQAIDGDEMLRSLAVLDAEHRIVVVLRFWADLPLAAIAERLAIPPGTVKSRLHYALRQLRNAIEMAGER